MNKLNVALTFDDGYLEQYGVAHLLSRLQIRATFFIVTHLGRFEGKTLLASRPKIINEISKMGHEIGSHTKTHPRLTGIPLERVEGEVEESKNFLDSVTGSEIAGFAYPYGNYNSQIISIVRKHYRYARGAGIGQTEHMFNSRLTNRYALRAIGKQRKTIGRLLRLPVDLARPSKDPFIGLGLIVHRESLLEVMGLISYLRLLPFQVSFVTMKELAELTSEVGRLDTSVGRIALGDHPLADRVPKMTSSATGS